MKVATYRPLFFSVLFTAVFAGVLPAEIISVDSAPLSTIRHDRSDSSYLNLASSFEATGRLTWPGFLCSGNFIRNSGPFGWVLTAAHCVDDGTSADAFSFAVGGMSYAGDAIFTAPTYTDFSGSLSKGDDIALLRLATTVTDVTPATIYRGTAELGELAVNVGFGQTGTGLTGAQPGTAGTKRAVRNSVDAFFSPGEQLASDFDNPDSALDNSIGSSTPLDLEGLIAPGDSGGGLYIDFGSGPELAGIHSFVTTLTDESANSDYGDLSGSTRVSNHAAWIDSTIALNSAAVPEPSTYVLALCIGVLAAVRRKRRQRTFVAA